MSAAANWSYTGQATIWPQLAREDWSGGVTFGAPVQIACSYKAATKTRTDARGREYTSTMEFYTEHAAANPGDKIAIGVHTGNPPPDAREIRDVLRSQDIFDNVADDYRLIT